MNDSASFDCSRFAELLTGLGVATSEQIRGCSAEEVAAVLATKEDVRVPRAYVEFLRCFGRGAGHLLRGTDFCYPDCLEFNADAEDFAREDDPALVTEGRFFFAVHQGYEFYFFAHADERVWCYAENDGRPHLVASSFPVFLERAVDHPRSHWDFLTAQDRRNAEAKKRLSAPEKG